MSRSIRVAPKYIPHVKLALQRSEFPSQNALAIEMGKSRDTIRKFLNGIGIEYLNFVEICEKLGLNWQDIVYKEHEEPAPTRSQPDLDIDIDTLVQNVREKVKPFIKKECSTMRVLSMTRPIAVRDIYTHVNVLEKITRDLRLEIAELLQGFNDPNKFDSCGLNRTSEPSITGLKAVEKDSRLMVLGKPGAGKTTFLKSLALQCSEGNLQSSSVPIFISLKDFGDDLTNPTLLEYITKQLSDYNIEAEEIEQLLLQGKMMVLLDGLDEVKEDSNSRVLSEITHFSKRYDKNRFVMSCRIAVQEYTFENFTEVEVADFNEQQIHKFVENWFNSNEEEKKEEKAKRFRQNLERQPRIKELTKNPLLLTLLCLLFEDKGEFVSRNRYEVYKEATDTLLVKWDKKRNIERDLDKEKFYKNLSLGDRKYLLSYIAFTTFEKEDYFLSKINLVKLISKYIRNFPDVTKTNPEQLELDSELVLRSIEAQHGLLVERAKNIYSFSHFTFLEYFTAREIANRSDPDTLKEALSKLVSHITDKRWREVFLLAVVPLYPADYFLKLMKQEVDSLVAKDKKLQEFLKWVNKKSLEIQKCLPETVSCKPAAIRSFYLDSDIDIDPQRTLGFLIDFNCLCVFACASFLYRALKNISLDKALEIVGNLDRRDFSRYRALDAATAIVFVRVFAINEALKIDPNIDDETRKRLEELKAQVKKDDNQLIDWVQDKGQAWAEEVRTKIVKSCRIGEDWIFEGEQKKLLTEYYEANVLLMACLNNAYVSNEVRQEIENNLLLPCDKDYFKMY
ncbi:NACHT domain-containing NTPase [Kamptonema sp. UHCC 0994]|uniref:NACHT domain-containing protein n=1 Tax=Kamptonema sp. UHCC 0994 TaxID=3031329 RepID=UPI0023B88E25|nr:NACHT domain-containing NTPase [Kamptonema sp. UHCC 0994]MDF0552548.1 NACHT domain-containing NTPase [Kamptonema sp. UHCC 0994]